MLQRLAVDFLFVHLYSHHQSHQMSSSQVGLMDLAPLQPRVKPLDSSSYVNMTSMQGT